VGRLSQIQTIQHTYRQPVAILIYISSRKYMAWRKTNSLAEDKELAKTARNIKGLGNCNPILVNKTPNIEYPTQNRRIAQTPIIPSICWENATKKGIYEVLLQR